MLVRYALLNEGSIKSICISYERKWKDERNEMNDCDKLKGTVIFISNEWI